MLEIRDVTYEEGRTIRGIAAPFSDPAYAAHGTWAGPEVIAPGAIEDGVTVPLLDGHDGPQVGTVEIRAESDGYHVHGTTDESEAGKAFYERAKRIGAALSIGFDAISAPIRNGVRVLESVAIDHVAAVKEGAYGGAQIVEVRQSIERETTMTETTEVAAAESVATDTNNDDDLLEIRTELQDVQRQLQVAKVEAREPNPGRIPELRTAGEYLYHAHRVLAPDMYSPEEVRIAKERLRMDELEVRTTATSGDSPLPIAYEGDLVRLARSGRPFCNAMGSRGLSSSGLTITRFTQATAGSWAWEGSEGAATTDDTATTGSITAGIKAAKTLSSLTMQAALRSDPGMVDIVLQDQAATGAAALDSGVLNGTGTLALTTGELAGILANASIQDETLATFDAAAVVAALTAAVGNVVTATNSPPAFIAMHPRRWSAFHGLLDSTNRPLLAIDGRPSQNTVGGGSFGAGSLEGGATAMGSIWGMPVVLDSNLPTDLGGGTEDIIVLYGAGSFELYESGNMRAQHTTPATFITEYGAAFMASLIPTRPEGVCTISGAGLVP